MRKSTALDILMFVFRLFDTHFTKIVEILAFKIIADFAKQYGN